MKLRAIIFAFAALMWPASSGPLAAPEQTAGPTKEVIMLADQLAFKEVVPGVSRAVLWGDPETGAYGALTKFKAGTKNARHTHTSDLRIVGIRGAYIYETEAGKTMIGPGSYMFVPGGKPHVSGADQDTLFFEEAAGKFDINFLEQRAQGSDG